MAFKNSKYLFYCFNDFIKAYGNPRYKPLNTRKMFDTVGKKKIEEKNKQFLIEKIIHKVEFESIYHSNPEKKPEIMSTIKSNYKVARRVYQQLHLDISEFFADFIRSMSSYELHDMDEDIKANGWGIIKVTEVQDAQELMKIFQDFYTLAGRLPLYNGLLVVPDGDVPSGEKISIKQLYDLFKNIYSHGLVSLPFLGLIQYYLEKNDHSLIRNVTTELYLNLSYSTLSGATDFQFGAVSDLIGHISFLITKSYT